MEREEQLRVVKGLMSHLDNGTNVDGGGPTLVRVYPCADDPNNSFAEISFYSHKAMQEAAYFEGQERPGSATMEERSRYAAAGT